MQDIWARFDPRRRGYIPVHRLKQFVVMLGPPLGHQRLAPLMWQAIRYEALHIHEKGRGIPFNDFAVVLILAKLGAQVCSRARVP